ncbi:MAG: hypothetical protein AAB929_01250 [Patescibacteria group bacterium]
MIDKRRPRQQSAQKKKRIDKDLTFSDAPTNTAIKITKNPKNTEYTFSDAPANTADSVSAISLEQIQEVIRKNIEPAMGDMKRDMREDMEKMIKERQTMSFEVLGIFVALFTFVSINFQIFNQIETLNYAIVLGN